MDELNITDAKRKKLDEAKAKWGEKWSELAEINSKKAKARTELEAAEKVREDAKKGRVDGLVTQYRTLQNKPGKKTYKEYLFLHNVLGWIKKWEILKTDDTFDPDAELAKLDAVETVNQGKLAKYNNWVGHGNHFTERLGN